jgi:DNA topoisomerase-1
MNKKIIFLESTTKKKTIKSFLGSNYVIFATSGHLREIKKKGPYNLGVDLEKFVPEYEIMKEKSGLVRF